MPTTKAARAQCPECEQSIEVKSPRMGMQFACPKCDTQIEVIELSPLELDWAEGDFFDDEDLSDYSDYDEDDDYDGDDADY